MLRKIAIKEGILSDEFDSGVEGDRSAILRALQCLRRSAELQLSAFDHLTRTLTSDAPFGTPVMPDEAAPEQTDRADPRSGSGGTAPEAGSRELTSREHDVLALLVQGCSNRQIARSLHISDHTVRAHLQVIFRKLGVSHRTAAAVVAVRSGLVRNGTT